MEPWCKTPAPSRVQAGLPLLLLLLLLRQEGCSGTGEALGTQLTAVPHNSGDPCAPSATCPSRGPRLPRQLSAATTVTLPTMTPPTMTQRPATPQPATPRPATPLSVASLPVTPQPSQSPVSHVNTATLPVCGMSQEPDPTLRDPEAVARRWPWTVSVRANDTHICAGALIASQWVLTTAHCLIPYGANYSIRAGSPRINQIAQTASEVPVRQVIVNSRFRRHRLWSWVGQVNNIALLHLEWAVKYSKYAWPICLPDLGHEVRDQSLCTVTGWGHPKVNGTWPQFQTIQEKEVTLLNREQCESFYHRFSKVPSVIRIINSKMLCAEDPDRKYFCYETSGEPLACPVENRWYLVGMVSWGPGCGKKEAPPIYLRISAYKHWIWERMNGQALSAPSGALLLTLPLLLSLLAAH